ncbi:sulfurtransferase TusA family protein [Brevundimonas sp.]|jgi:tRNA 2-thiouridine synthesizing protein A|uniref:sulfurtransferase TusA family protein n=1 Tax=Brevundimonas sp. TaxID=1871086 RepID=UPI00391AAC1F
MSDDLLIDARGHRCPVPTLRLRKALADAPYTGRAVLLASDPMARIDVPYLMQELGGHVVEISEVDGVLTIIVERPVVPTG